MFISKMILVFTFPLIFLFAWLVSVSLKRVECYIQFSHTVWMQFVSDVRKQESERMTYYETPNTALRAPSPSRQYIFLALWAKPTRSQISGFLFNFNHNLELLKATYLVFTLPFNGCILKMAVTILCQMKTSSWTALYFIGLSTFRKSLNSAETELDTGRIWLWMRLRESKWCSLLLSAVSD